jgi:glycosyltransferase involved in cell wall biosynthesis
MDNKFSIIIPTHNRPDKVIRAIKSCLNQTYGNYEIIVVDDGSVDDTSDRVRKLQQPHIPLSYLRQVRQQRLIARNAGMRLARFNWIVWMDDDDELLPNYLEEFNKAINLKPEFNVFACSVDFYKVVEGKEKLLRTLKCPRLSKDMTGIGFDNPKRPWPHFTSGRITTGQFIFKKEDLKVVGYLPHTHLYGDFAVMSGIPGYGWVPPQPPRFPEKRVQVMGNPWGEDFYIFYKLTRYYNVFPIDIPLYKKNCR